MAFTPRLCHIKKRADFPRFGFTAHADTERSQTYIKKIDDGSPAKDSGLLEGDIVIEVNGVNIENETHPEVVERMKARGDEMKLLVVGRETYKYYKDKGITIRSSMPEVRDVITRQKSSEGTGGALQKAIEIVTKAVEEDKKMNYPEALRLYEHAVDYFLHAIKYEAQSDKAKESIRAKCVTYVDRAEKLKCYVYKKKLKQPANTEENTFFDDSDESEDENSLPGMAFTLWLCHIKKRADFPRFGFTAQAVTESREIHIKKIDDGSLAKDSGLLEGDIVIEVNGVNIENETHPEVVERMRARGDETELLVVDSEAYKYYKDKGITIRSSMPEVRNVITRQKSSEVTKPGGASVGTLQKAFKIVTKAMEEDKKKNYSEAFRLYEHAVAYLLHALKYEAHSDKAKKSINAKCMTYLDRAERLKCYKKKLKQPANTEENTFFDDSDESEDENSLPGEVFMEKPNMKLDDVAGLEEAKQTLKEAVIIPVQFPQLFSGKRKPWKGILLVGPPGTGKTSLAKAVAAEANNSTFLYVPCADLVSKWSGGSEKKMKDIFRSAHRHKPCVMFFHEVHALFDYSDEQSTSIKRMITEFLTQMYNADTGTSIIGSTQKPWLLNPAIIKKFEKRIHIQLPDAQARTNIFKMEIGNAPHSLTEEDLRVLSEMSEGYSGADISTVVRDALMQTIRKIQNATHFKKVHTPTSEAPAKASKDLLTPCSPEDSEAFEMKFTAIPGDSLRQPDLEMVDIMKLLQAYKATAKTEELLKIQKFISDYVG